MCSQRVGVTVTPGLPPAAPGAAAGTGADGPAASCAGTGSAEPFTYSLQGWFHAVQPFPFTSDTSVPVTVTGSPMWVIEKSQAEFPIDILRQPCDTFRTPWS